jgi:hypothetical protein
MFMAALSTTSVCSCSCGLLRLPGLRRDCNLCTSRVQACSIMEAGVVGPLSELSVGPQKDVVVGLEVRQPFVEI